MNISCRELCSILLIHSSQLQEFFPRLCMYNLCFYMISSSSLYLYSGYYSTYWWDLETYFLVLAHLSCDGKHVLWYLSNSIISSIKYICWRSPWIEVSGLCSSSRIPSISGLLKRKSIVSCCLFVCLFCYSHCEWYI